VARTSATIRADIDALREAMATGAASVSYEGRTVTYRSYQDMRLALGDLLDELAGAEGTPRLQIRYASYRSGY
jgi:hypothetical protein